ncbi:MAG: type II toxin-antitoxin system RelE/ParE family toxin [Mycolicibacter algericus]|uniref:Toxin n=2 Tax=Mycolicibacter algericus TaxID=1288388 RepID=A0A7I9YET6_MYCAL|nr:type II toxin-antitoxin system RelE/ParE family toxin [Mycolicibacter algericus]OQZ98232.1 plasmid stabilization protein ParE [Mycolicibacter algericus DSM 45454]GFG87209.1 toxin ParE1 [Mycolicibacter algericus]
MTVRYLLSPAARADLEQIWDYTADRWGVDQAEEYLRELQYAIERLAANPRIGRTCDEIRPGYRKLSAGSHTLFYRLTADAVVDVVRVLHQRMDTERHL